MTTETVEIPEMSEIGRRHEAKELFVVRLYDGFDNVWTDVSKPVGRKKAESILDEKTKGGTRNTKFDDIDYYAIFPADTTMYYNGSAKDGSKGGR